MAHKGTARVGVFWSISKIFQKQKRVLIELKGKIEIKAKPGFGTRIYLDGKEIENVYAYSVEQSVTDGCMLHVDIHTRHIAKAVEFEADNVEASLIEDVLIE